MPLCCFHADTESWGTELEGTRQPGGGLIVTVGDNLFDEREELCGYFYAPGVVSGALSRSRTWGVGAAYYF